MGKLPLEKLSFGKMYIWEVAACEIPHLRSCLLGKCPWEVADWETAFGKVPNIPKTGPCVTPVRMSSRVDLSTPFITVNCYY